MIHYRSVLVVGLLSASLQFSAGAAVPAEEDSAQASWRTYSVYQPDITDHVIIGWENSLGLKYRHVAAIEYFKGEFYAACNGNTIFGEAKPGQACYMARSKDGKTWGDPFRVTPVTCLPGGKYAKGNIQWQGGLFNWKNEELWFFWGEEPNSAVHLSVLKDPDGPWTDRIIQGGVVMDGVQYSPFPCNNPIVLPNGRIMLPIVIQNYPDHTPDGKPMKWPDVKKFSVALVSDDEGKNWHIEKGTLIPEDPPADPLETSPEDTNGKNFVGVWEPMYEIQSDGRVRAFTRTAGNRLFTAVGDKEGRTMGPWKQSGIRTLQSRHWVGRDGARWIMVHHDDYRTEVNWKKRRNLALFFSRTGEDDFVAGNSIAGRDVQIQYPQALVHDDKLYVAYTYDICNELHCVIVDPLPKASEYYVFPRGDRRGMGDFADDQPEGRTEAFIENGHKMLRLRGNAAAGVDIDGVNPQTDTVDLRFPVKFENGESWDKMMIIATVGDDPIMLGYCMKTPDRLNICIDGKWQDAAPFSFESWHCVKLSVNKKRIRVNVDGQSKEFPPAKSFNGRVYLGDGYPSEQLSSRTRYIIDISGLGTQVRHITQ